MDGWYLEDHVKDEDNIEGNSANEYRAHSRYYRQLSRDEDDRAAFRVL